MRIGLFLLGLLVCLSSCMPTPTPPLGTPTFPPTRTPTPTRTPSLTPTPSLTNTPIPLLLDTSTPTLPAATVAAIATDNAFINQVARSHNLEAPCPIGMNVNCRWGGVSPDRRWVYVYNRDTAQLLTLKLVSADGTQSWDYTYASMYAHRLKTMVELASGQLTPLRWDGDGRSLYISADDLTEEDSLAVALGYHDALFRVNLMTGKWLDLDLAGAIQFSPNGRYIAAAYGGDVTVHDLQTGNRDVYSLPDLYYTYTGAFLWSPDNEKLVFVATPSHWDAVGARFAIYEVNQAQRSLTKRAEFEKIHIPVRWDGPEQLILRESELFGLETDEAVNLAALAALPTETLTATPTPTSTPTITDTPAPTLAETETPVFTETSEFPIEEETPDPFLEFETPTE